ncbi:K+-dependent Na+/Ca+ exchanger [Desulfuromonas versatilis]|uniref:K+-dependent Na+/Ca+ exchanger n=1 Tax=Desulfuromonas versatilis TaxID=2802975 RepID=A0ABM8HY54_9BACT|nr:calcium/sodium antiporter [Desulfuromonas versatilis]BCR05737.1 K+-dependent Na+/Ca+ exchanger [Desulfuromonas versatilis]
MVLAAALFVSGLLVLYFGAESLVKGSSRLALSFGVRPLIIGMTIVAFATSMPELMVSLSAALRGSSDIAAGNIIGSNVANIGLILGAAALLKPLAVPPSTLKRELPFMIGASLLLFLFALDGRLTFGEGLLLFLLLAVFLGYCLRRAREQGLERPAPEALVARERASRNKDLLLILIGMGGLGAGAELMVRSAVTIARGFGISELVIGISIVALGTSLPELAASLVSAARGQMDISLGNVIGSNIFNILFVLGICPMIRPLAIDPGVLRFELPVMLLFSVALLPLARHRLSLGPVKGGLLLCAYSAFILALFL